jgi:hypothetical protein
MKRNLLILVAALLAFLGLVVAQSATAQQPFGTPSTQPPVVTSGTGTNFLIAPAYVTGASTSDLQVVSADSFPRVTLRQSANGTVLGTFGVASGASNLITGTVASNLAIRNSSAILLSADAGVTAHVKITATGIQEWNPILFANLGTPTNGSLAYCSDCTLASPCAGAGTGAFAKRLNGVWVCN